VEATTKPAEDSFLQLSKSLQGLTPKLLDLTREENKESHEPLVSGCDCYCCKHYTRAYIYHMLEVKEMNANILLAMHNMKQYDLLFAMLRDNLAGRTLSGFIEAYLEANCTKRAEQKIVNSILETQVPQTFLQE